MCSAPTLNLECSDEALMPSRSHEGDAGLDLRSREVYNLVPLESKLIGTGIKAEIPLGYVGLLFSRSGMAKSGVTLANSVGVIDHAYRGEIKAYLTNNGNNPFLINFGDRIAQLVIVPCLLVEPNYVEKVSESVRGENGFGSTGTT